MAVQAQLGAIQHGLQLVAQNGNRAGVVAVGRRGEKPEEPVLANDHALFVVALDADVVHVAQPVDGGARIGLGQDQRLGITRLFADRVGHGRETLRQGFAARLAQQPQAAVRDHMELVALPAAAQVVPAIAQEGEVIVAKPPEKGRDLAQMGLVHRRGADLQFFDRLVHLGRHGAPILDGDANVLQHRRDLPVDCLDLLAFRLPIHLEMHPGFVMRTLDGTLGQQIGDLALAVSHRRDDGMDDQMDGQPQIVERHRHRIDEKRHVVGDDLHDGVIALPAVLLRIGVVDVDLALPRATDVPERPMRQRGAVEVFHPAVRDVFRRDVLVVQTHETLDGIGLVLAPALAHPLRRGLHDCCPSLLIRDLLHGRFPRSKLTGTTPCAFVLMSVGIAPSALPASPRRRETGRNVPERCITTDFRSSCEPVSASSRLRTTAGSCRQSNSRMSVPGAARKTRCPETGLQERGAERSTVGLMRDAEAGDDRLGWLSACDYRLSARAIPDSRRPHRAA